MTEMELQVPRESLREGLDELRRLVQETHWIKGSYLQVYYMQGDGVYEDGAVVEDSKVVGCLVGLARLVGAKKPSYVKGKRLHREVEELPRHNDLSRALEDAIIATIEAEDPVYEDRGEDEGHSIEGWNDDPDRDRDQVLALLDRTIERVGADG